jgi:hypothetical protein
MIEIVHHEMKLEGVAIFKQHGFTSSFPFDLEHYLCVKYELARHIRKSILISLIGSSIHTKHDDNGHMLVTMDVLIHASFDMNR